MSERKGNDGTSRSSNLGHGYQTRPITFPTHNSPRTWLLTSALSPLHIRLMRILLAHGDHVVACLHPHEMEDEYRSAEFRELINDSKSGRRGMEGWRDRIRSVRCDGRIMGQCGAAVAEAMAAFGGIDILLCCRSEAFVGNLEELSTTPSTRNLVREQFDAIFFSQVNFIKATLPLLRARQMGHIVTLTSTGGHIGTPGLGVYTAATWALEGFCDSLAYEVAPFNVKVTIVQPNKEIQILTNQIVFAPPLEWYVGTAGATEQESRGDSSGGEESTDVGSADATPSIRDIFSRVLNQHPDTAIEVNYQPISWEGHDTRYSGIYFTSTTSSKSVAAVPESLLPLSENPLVPQDPPIISRYPRLPLASIDLLVTETVHALAAIGGHENPPTRHIVGYEGTAAVQEKLRTVTEELEDFITASCAVDVIETEPRMGAHEANNIEMANKEQGRNYDDGP